MRILEYDYEHCQKKNSQICYVASTVVFNGEIPHSVRGDKCI